ncbi:MAG: hypothetical protein HDS18_03310 [Bacteroides sp.]|nr:hypothetical protein [Bacteroides sp.]
MKAIIRFLLICMFFGLAFLSEGCTGCAKRQRHARERHRERVESRASSDDDDSDDNDRRSSSRRKRGGSDSDQGYSGAKYSPEEIEILIEGEDYDAMINAMFSQVKELKGVKNEYFKGNMPDKVAEERVEEIKKRYAPLRDKLSQASSEGSLTYNQHKRQVKLFGEYQKLVVSIISRLGNDLESALE